MGKRASALRAQPELKSAQAMAGQAHGEARPTAVPERARAWAMAVGEERPPSARRRARLRAQSISALGHQLPMKRRTSLYLQKNRDFSSLELRCAVCVIGLEMSR